MTESNEMCCVVSNPPISMLKAGDLLITIRESDQPYLGDPNEVAKGFSNPLLTAAWVQHRTWIAFDLQNRDIPRERADASLAKLVANLLDTRCVGIYLPKENQFTIESDGSAANQLKSLSSA